MRLYHSEYPDTLEPIDHESNVNMPTRPDEKAMTDAAIERHQARLAHNIFMGFLNLFGTLYDMSSNEYELRVCPEPKDDGDFARCPS